MSTRKVWITKNTYKMVKVTAKQQKVPTTKKSK